MQKGNTGDTAIMKLGGIAGLLSVGGGIADIIIGSATGANLETLATDAAGRFAEFSRSPLLGLYRLDALNMILGIIGLAFAAALFLYLRRDREGPALLALVLSVAGTCVMVSGNAAFGMLELSGAYASSRSDSARAIYLAAGEALLVRGMHGSLAILPAFVLPVLANALFSLAMRGLERFGRATAMLGLIGYSLLLVYLILVTFVPGSGRFALALAAPGGIVALVWTGKVSWVMLTSRSKAAFSDSGS